MSIVTSPRRSWRLDALFIGVLLLIAGVLHAIYQFGSLYGEHDAARFVVDGVIWAKTGVRSIALSEYRYFVSPAFIYLSKLACEWSLASGIHPEIYLCAITNVAAVLLFVPTYLLFSNLIGPAGAFVGCLFVEMSPALWFSSLYGFPTAIALLFVLTALLLWDEYLRGRILVNTPFHLSLMFLAALLGMLFKADILVLSAPAFAGLALIRFGFAWRKLAIAVIVVTGAILVGYSIGHALVQDSAQSAQYAAAWNQQFDPGNAAAIGLGKMDYVDSVRLYVMSLGLLTLPAVLVALILMLKAKQWAFAVAIAIWLPASFLFWAWRPGDGSRHHVPAVIPAALAIGYLFASAARLPRFRLAIYGFLALVVLVNAFRYKPSVNTASPSGRLLASARMVRDDAAQIQRRADAYVAGNCDAVLLGSPLTPYSEAALLLRAQKFTVRPEQEDGYLIREIDYDRNGSLCHSTNVRVLSRNGATKAAEVFRAQGKNVQSYEYKLVE